MSKIKGFTPLEKKDKKMKRNFLTGFTLVELIIAMVIIAIVSVCSLEFLRFCQKNFISNAESRFMAANYARETMEGLYWLPSSELVDVTASPVPLPVGSNLSATRTYTVSPRNGYKVITVLIKDWTR